MTTDYQNLVLCMFTIGMVATIRAQVGFIYLFENMRVKHYERLAAVFGLIEGSLALLGALYFHFLSKSWFPLIFGAFCVTAAASVGSLFLLESPRYLIKSGQITYA